MSLHVDHATREAAMQHVGGALVGNLNLREIQRLAKTRAPDDLTANGYSQLAIDLGANAFLSVAKGVALDCETHLVQPGLSAPPVVCGSVATYGDGTICESRLLTVDESIAVLENVLHSDRVLIGQNISYDLLCLAVEAAKRGRVLIPDIFRMYAEARVFDVGVCETLHAIANGTLGYDPRSGGPLKSPSTGKPAGYSLEVVTDLVLGRRDAKANDEWRLRYSELEGIPFAHWPVEARQYPIDDAVNTLDCARAQVVTRRNLHDLPAQVFAAWAMHLGAAWGFNTDAEMVAELKERYGRERTEQMQQFVGAGLLRSDGSKDTGIIKNKTAVAYGCTAACTTCAGTGRTVSEKSGNKIQCKKCSATGFDLDAAPVPRTPTGGCQTSRDTLYESGDELLMLFGAYLEGAKILETYVPWLEQGIGADGANIPLTLSPNALVATGRPSYRGCAATLPRKGGVRECIVARPGHVLCSVDYGGVELCTHGQSCLWLLGNSEIANALNNGVKLHDKLGARMAGVTYEEMLARAASGFLADCRQAAKPLNFGLPGGMGAAKLVLQQRKQGPDTTAHGHAYKGLRFCVLIGGERECGTEMITEWKRRPITPTCKRCIECAEQSRDQWFTEFPENRPYFKLIAKLVDELGFIEQHVSRRIRGGLSFTSGANTFFQGLAADGGKLALCRVSYEQYVDTTSPLYGTRTIMFLYDELIVEMREEIAHEAAHRLAEVMIAAMREFVPDVTITAEPALMRRMYKSAEAIYDDAGRLIPWEPS